jgi:excisionase family DNA binding protein
MNEPETFVPIDDVAKHFSVSVSTVRSWIRKNRIPKHTYIKLGTTYRFKIGAIEEALTSENEGTEPQAAAPISLY